MTASPSVDAYDAQMLDFPSDTDVPMNITGSAELFAEALMDQDGHLVVYSEHPSIEVDMEEYVGGNGEYEMADETTEYHRPHAEELLDIEVYDASHAPSPLVTPQLLQPPVDVPIGSEPQTTTAFYSEHATHPELQGEPEPEVHLVPLDHPATDISHVEPSASGESLSLEAAALGQSSVIPDESHPPSSESHEQPDDLARANGQLLEASAPGGTDNEAEPLAPPIVEVHAVNAEVVQHDKLEPPTAESAPLPEDVDATGVAVRGDKADPASTIGRETVDSLYISDGVYIDPPPSVLLSVVGDLEPGFALFNPPDVGDESTEEALANQKVYSLLLADRPTLYYEPLSSVFEAFRQDEGFLSRVQHSFEGELVLDALDLQLAVSEDNVHSREISLHDLNVLHDGSNFVGPLRLHLRAIVPRFIIRYYALQEQIQRLHVATETGEGEHHEENHEHYETAEEQPLPQQEEVAGPPSLALVLAEDLEVPPSTEAERLIKKPLFTPEPIEETPQESHEPENGSVSNEPAAEYHEVTGEVTHALEDENDYGSTNEGESAKSDILDADQVHEVAAEDTDAPATVTGQESEFGGEQTEYLDFVQPEEYDERYGEELPERAGGAYPVQYGETLHYEEEGEQDTSTAVDETRTILRGSDENEEVSVVTPTAARPVLEPETSNTIVTNTNELVSPKQDISTLGNDEPVTSESKNEIDYVRPPSSQEQEQSTVQAKIFSEVEESDSNSAKLLERDADAEFDQSFSTEHNRQEDSIEATLPHDEAWDDWDDEDAEGDDEEDWIDPDADSNESSVTLSSKASSKRNYAEVDPSDELTTEIPLSSPESKRPRIE